MIRVLFAAAMLATAPCSQPPMPQPEPPPAPAPVPEPIDIEGKCAVACKRMRDLGCEGWDGNSGEDEVWGTSDDVSCRVVCTSIELDALTFPGLTLHPDCVAAADSCEAASACNR